ncbi:MAG: hypothetical protein M3178_12405 [Pseudomonadota bacterium]|nr:hypothetical protein [Pseudomonadota bacterium]
MSGHDTTTRLRRVPLQTTIPATEYDWSIERFSLLQKRLASIEDAAPSIVS